MSACGIRTAHSLLQSPRQPSKSPGRLHRRTAPRSRSSSKRVSSITKALVAAALYPTATSPEGLERRLPGGETTVGSACDGEAELDPQPPAGPTPIHFPVDSGLVNCSASSNIAGQQQRCQSKMVCERLHTGVERPRDASLRGPWVGLDPWRSSPVSRFAPRALLRPAWPDGRLLLNLLASIAGFELEMIRESDGEHGAGPKTGQTNGLAKAIGSEGLQRSSPVFCPPFLL